LVISVKILYGKGKREGKFLIYFVRTKRETETKGVKVGIKRLITSKKWRIE